MQTRTKTQTGVQPHSPTLGEIKTKHLHDAISSNFDENQPIVDAYIEHSDALIRFLMDDSLKDLMTHDVWDTALSCMFQQHILLLNNINDDDDDDDETDGEQLKEMLREIKDGAEQTLQENAIFNRFLAANPKVVQQFLSYKSGK